MFNPGSPVASASITTIRNEAGWYIPGQAKLIELSGEDRKGWLQGQVTQDMRDLRIGHSLAFCLVSPTGQLEAMGSVWATEEKLFVVVDEPQVMLDRVQRFVILEDVRAQVLDGEFLTVQGARATKILAEKFPLPTVDVSEAEGNIFIRHDRTGSGGWDILATPSLANWIRETLPQISDEVLNIATLEAGIPLPGQDTDAKTLPPELGSSFESRNVSHKKGCYQGQEVLMRIHSRGRTTKTWVGIFLDQVAQPGEPVLADGQVIGKLCRVAESQTYGWIATAILKNDYAYGGTPVKVGEQSGEVAKLPFLRYD